MNVRQNFTTPHLGKYSPDQRTQTACITWGTWIVQEKEISVNVTYHKQINGTCIMYNVIGVLCVSLGVKWANYFIGLSLYRGLPVNVLSMCIRRIHP